MFKKALVLLAVVLSSLLSSPGAPAFAAEDDPLVSDRPDFTESTSTITRGRVQVEAGATVEDGDADATTFGELLVRIGLHPSWELRLGLGSYVDEKGGPSGRDDGSIGFKVHLLDGDGLRPDLALLAGTSVGTGSSSRRESSLQPEVKLAFAWDLGERLGLASNLGWARPVDGDERFDELSWSLSLAAELRGPLSGYLELYGFDPDLPGSESTTFANGGVTYLLNDDLQLDARLGVGLGDAQPEAFGGVGIVARW